MRKESKEKCKGKTGTEGRGGSEEQGNGGGWREEKERTLSFSYYEKLCMKLTAAIRGEG